jgi:hypothetical protein
MSPVTFYGRGIMPNPSSGGGGGGGGGSCDITAASASSSDVQAAINSASNGQTVCVTGVATWSTTVSIPSTKYVRLHGGVSSRVEGISIAAPSLSGSDYTFTVISGSTITGFNVGEAITAYSPYSTANSITGTVKTWNGSTSLVIASTSTTGSTTETWWVFRAGTASTVITHNVSGGPALQITPHASGVTQVDGIRFESASGGDTQGNHSQIYIASNTGVQPQIYDCHLLANGSRRLFGLGGNKGLFYRCYLDAIGGWGATGSYPGYGLAIKFDNGLPAGNATWEQAPTVGTLDTTGQNNVYVEDCFAVGLTTELSDTDDNGRLVWRHSVQCAAGHTSHGADSSNIGARHQEYYNNMYQFKNMGNNNNTPNVNYWMFLRGGAMIFANNTSDDISSSQWGNKSEIAITVENLRRNDGPNPCWGAPTNPGEVYPAPHQPGQGWNSGAQTEGIYVYGTTGTAAIGIQDFSCGDAKACALCASQPLAATYLVLNQDYFTRAPGVGEPYNGYTPYTYPHPQRLG